MICAVHAVVGAAVGKLVGSRAGAFAAGVATHFVGDLLPHKDFDPKVEAPLLLGALGLLANRCGVDSPEFAGAVGGVLPDAENAAAIVGLLPHDRKVFPTHAPDDAFHGPKTRSAWPQAVAAAFCLVYVLSGKRR